MSKKAQLVWAPPRAGKSMGGAEMVARLMCGTWEMVLIYPSGKGYWVSPKPPLGPPKSMGGARTLDEAKAEAERVALEFLRSAKLDSVVAFPDRTIRVTPRMATTGNRRLELGE